MGILASFDAAAGRLHAALTDPARRERTIAFTLVVFTALWTVYGVLAKASQGVHFDMAELADLANHLSLGNAKNPPFAIWLTAAWFAVFPHADWAFYLLSMVCIAVALAAAWRLYGRLLDPDKQVLALAAISLVPLLTFHALKFNNNVLMIPLWSLTILWFVRSFDEHRLSDAALAGFAAAAAMMTKYWSVFLVVGLVAAVLSDRRRNDYFRSPAPWVTAGCGALALAPHLLWLVANHFLSFSYAVIVHGGRGFSGSIVSVIGYLGGAAGYAAPAVLVALAATRPTREALADMLLPPDGPRRFIAIAFWTMLLAPVPVALATGTEIVSLWSMPVWPLLPAVMLSSPKLSVGREALARAVALAVAVPIVAVAIAPAVALIIHRNGSAGAAAFYEPLARAVQRDWNAVTKRPLAYVGGDGNLAYGVTFYLARPVTAYPDFNAVLAPWVRRQALLRDGIVMVCAAEEEACIARIKAYAANASSFRINEATLVDRFWDRDGATARFVIVVVPPQSAVAGRS
jgi:4-amino-4-deoxy-L-arabinose transferase-like glycosyltransferase